MTTALLVTEPMSPERARVRVVEFDGTWISPTNVRVREGEKRGDQVLFSATEPDSLGDGVSVLHLAIYNAYPADNSDDPDLVVAFGKGFEEEFIPECQRLGLITS